ncbi:maleylpyruvate isomerase N-terminal domain-containing protein [Pseudonocardia sp. DSM 110487]|uniref:maleylpyruvate isomerase N-terminal domain-containing protein n=1 Tax=Pseudonocardia sp. DSM 110487 TaxID=2865833 RepID=UPI001C6A3998|nr:maleylpyruvate isomerase N-terminal domain-containing protein [Pseudonocardia sp. DSM 110487]QYN38978.1 maleylpyruvate isomerase N-terminal domain-containing protein [Pseudonocardia sp. DSM 110487]
MTEDLADAETLVDAEPRVEALRSSVARLRGIAASMTEAELTGRAYPSEWTIADVLSHLGSGAVITGRRLDDTLAGRPTPDDFAPGVWDTWNGKTPVAQRDDALVADADLLARFEAVTPEQRTGFSSAMGPMTLGFTEFVGMRLNEHAFHTWDIEITRDPPATLPPQVAALVVDNLGLVAGFTAKPTGDATVITVATTGPERGFRIELAADSATFLATTATASADLTLPAEAFSRLVYGRLDPEHTAPDDHGPALDVLRRVFPGP